MSIETTTSAAATSRFVGIELPFVPTCAVLIAGAVIASAAGFIAAALVFCAVL